MYPWGVILKIENSNQEHTIAPLQDEGQRNHFVPLLTLMQYQKLIHEHQVSKVCVPNPHKSPPLKEMVKKNA